MPKHSVQRRHIEQGKKLRFLLERRSDQRPLDQGPRITKQEHLAAALGITPSAVARWCSGQIRMNNAYVPSLSEIYDFDAEKWALPLTEFIACCGGYEVTWDQVIKAGCEVIEKAIIHPKLETEKIKLKFSTPSSASSRRMQEVRLGTDFYYNVDCSMQFPGDGNWRDWYFVAIEYDIQRRVLLQLTSGKVGDNFDNHRKWRFPKPRSEPRRFDNADDIGREFDIVVFTFSNKPDTSLEENIMLMRLLARPLGMSTLLPDVSEFSTTYWNRKSQEMANAVRSRFLVVAK